MTRTWYSLRHRSKAVPLILALLVSSLTSHSAIASQGGTEDPKNKFTVGFTYKENGIPQICSGILIAPKIIATARHCVQSDAGVTGTEYVFTNPGAQVDGPGADTKIARVVTTNEDIAFIVLTKVLSGGTYLKIADSNTVSTLTDGIALTGHGYGAVFETAQPYSSLVRKYPLQWRPTGLQENIPNTYELTSPTASACRGDSGGPITAQISVTEQVLVAVLSGAANVSGTCGTPGADGLYRMRVTLVHPYLSQLPEYVAPTPTPSPAKKRIICFKGTKKKIVIAVKPKCPKGYRTKR